MNVASCRRPRRWGNSHVSLPVPDLAAARYVDREIVNAQAAAELCTMVAERGRWHGRSLVAAVLHDFAAEFADEAAFLAAAARQDVRWPRRVELPVTQTDLAGAIDVITGLLDDSERTLRWIARRLDLPSPAAVAFEALASARRSRRRLLSVCNEIECL